MGSSTPEFDFCFVYYVIAIVLLFVVGWGIILLGYPSRKNRINVDKSELGWPSNIEMWEYSIHSTIPYIIWTISVLLLMWGAFRADCREADHPRVQIYRFFFRTLIVFNISSFFTFFIAHNLIATLYLQSMILAITIGLIFIYSEINVNDAWLFYPYLLFTVYFIYLVYYANIMNKSHPDVKNRII